MCCEWKATGNLKPQLCVYGKTMFCLEWDNCDNMLYKYDSMVECLF